MRLNETTDDKCGTLLIVDCVRNVATINCFFVF